MLTFNFVDGLSSLIMEVAMALRQMSTQGPPLIDQDGDIRAGYSFAEPKTIDVDPN
jgi:hypothetical protein